MAAHYFTQVGQKRKASQEPIGLSNKVPNLASGPDSEDAWTCPACGNFNYGGRNVCNMKKCGKSRPIEAWTCPSCGNENLANRPFCNMRSCGLAKPGLRVQDVVPKVRGGGALPQAASVVQMQQMQQTQQQLQQLQQMVFPGQVAGSQPGGGDGQWTCHACGNLNWEKRSTCNGKRGACGVSRPGAGTGNIPSALPRPGGHRAQAMQTPFSLPVPKTAGVAQAPHPDGSWTCQLCQNVNWPQRSSCNKRGCGAPRPGGV